MYNCYLQEILSNHITLPTKFHLVRAMVFPVVMYGCKSWTTGCSGLVHWDDPEGLDGEWGGREVQDGEHMYIQGWFMSMYGKNHYHIVK